MEKQKYYIVSLKHMRRNDQMLLLWKPEFCGYTTNVNKAGKYTKEEVWEHYDCSNDFPIVEEYKDYACCISGKIANFLIPADDEVLEKIGLQKMVVITYL